MRNTLTRYLAYRASFLQHLQKKQHFNVTEETIEPLIHFRQHNRIGIIFRERPSLLQSALARQKVGFIFKISYYLPTVLLKLNTDK